MTDGPRVDIQEALQGYAGNYIGLSPSDESQVGAGELEVRIDDDGVLFRHATGLEIAEDRYDPTEIEEVPADQIRDLFENPEDLPEFRALQVGQRILLFALTNETEHPDVAVIGGMEDLLGPTTLFGPAQVEQGLHDSLIAKIELEHGMTGVIPRLSHGGLAPSEAPQA